MTETAILSIIIFVYLSIFAFWIYLCIAVGRYAKRKGLNGFIFFGIAFFPGLIFGILVPIFPIISFLFPLGSFFAAYFIHDYKEPL